MRKWIILVGILALFVGAVIVALLNLNSYLNRNRDLIVQQAETALGRSVSFDKIGVSFWGGLAAWVQNLRIADDPRFSKVDFLQAERFRVVVKLFPALSGRIEIRYVTLDRPTVSIIRTNTGYNFESLGRAPTGSSTSADGEKDQAPRTSGEQGKSRTIPPFLVAATRVSGAQINYRDETTKPASVLSLTGLHLAVSDLSLTKPIQLELAASILEGGKRNVQASASLGPIGEKLDLDTLPVNLEVDLGPFPIDRLKQAHASLRDLPLSGPHSARLQVTAHREASAVAIESLSLTLGNMALRGSGRVTPATVPILDLQLFTEGIALEDLQQILPALRDLDLGGSAKMHLQLNGKASAQHPPSVTGNLTLSNVDISAKGPPLNITGLSTRIALTGDSAELPPTEFSLGDSPVKTEGALANFSAPVANFALTSPSLRLASLGAAATSTRNEEVLHQVEIRGRLQTKPELQAAGKINASAATVRDVHLENLDAKWRFESGPLAKLDQITLNLYGGTVEGKGSYNATTSDPTFELDSRIRNTDVSRLIASQRPDSDARLHGRLDADLNVKGSGKTGDVIRESLNGNGRVEIKDGVLKDINVADSVLSGLTGIRGLTSFISPKVRQKYSGVFSTGDTRFDALYGTAEIGEGRVSTDDLTLVTQDYSIYGKGVLTLPNHLNLTATLVLGEKLSRDVVADVEEASYLTGEGGRLSIPFTVRGELPGVRPTVDSKFILKALQGGLIEKGLKKLFGGEKPKEEEQQTPETPNPPPGKDPLAEGLQRLFNR